MKFRIPLLLFFAVLLVSLSEVPGLEALGRPVAVVEMLEGSFTHSTPNTRIGLKRFDRIPSGSVLEAGKNAKILLRFRDGTWLRLFQNSRLFLKTEKTPEGSYQHFQREWVLLQGSLVAGLAGTRQQLVLKIPESFEIRISEGLLGVSNHAEGTSVSLSSGEARVRNALSSVTLKPGQWLNKVATRDPLNLKVLPVLNILEVEVIQGKAGTDKKDPVNPILKIQLKRRKSKRQLSLKLPVLLSSNMAFPQTKTLKLNSRGAASMELSDMAFLSDDKGYAERIQLMLSADAPGFEKIGAGFTEVSLIPQS